MEHELTTNAVKYGSSSVLRGGSSGACRALSQPLLWLEWRESNGPPVAAEAARGFGSRFITSSVAAELQGAARLHFDASGLRCTMEVPHEAGAVPDEVGPGWRNLRLVARTKDAVSCFQ